MVDELPAAPRVRRRLPERVRLGDPDRSGVQMLDHGRRLVEQPAQPTPSRDLLLRPPQLTPQEPADREVTVGREVAVLLDRPHQHGELGLEPANLLLDGDEPRAPIARAHRRDALPQRLERLGDPLTHADTLSNLCSITNTKP